MPGEVYCDFVGLNHLLWAQKILVNNSDKTKDIIASAHLEQEILANIPDLNYSKTFFESLGLLPISYLKYYYLAKEMYEE